MKEIGKNINPHIFDCSRDAFRKILDAIGDPVVITALEDGEIIEINESTLGYLDASRDEVIGRNFVEFGAWSGAAERQEFVRWLDPGGAVSKREFTFSKDEKEFIFILSARRIIFQKEPVVFVHLKDITEERCSTRMMAENERRLKEAERIAGLGHWEFIPERGELTWSDENYRILGYEPGEVEPSYQRFLDRMHPDDRKRVREIYDEAVENRLDSFEAVFRLLPHKGQVRFVRERGRLFFQDGRLKEARGIIQDITKEHEASLRLQQSEKRWNDTFNAIDDSLMLLDKDQTILAANRAASEFLGMKLQDMLGQKCYDLMHIEKKSPHHCPFRVTSGKKKSVRKEIFINRFEKTFMVLTSPVFDADGNIEYVVHLTHDITMFKKTEAMLRHAQKMEAIGTLAGGIAHDFNNILAGIMGSSELAQMHAREPDKVRKYLGASLNMLERGTELVKQILTFSRQDEKEKCPVILNALVKEIVKMLRATIPPGIEIHNDLPESDVVIWASPTNIHQLIMNLGTNAYQAMKDTGGRLTIGLKLLERLPENLKGVHEEETPGSGMEWALLQVTDTGCGMSTAIRERIFEPYFTTKEPGEGTGLGLSLVHGIVKQCKGHVSVESTPAQGTIFSVYLPVMQYTRRDLEETGTKEIVAGTGRIMLVDDEESIITLLQSFLEDIGYQVTGFTDPVSALKSFSDSPLDFDVMITDFAMPKMNGGILAREIRTIRDDIPIIIITGFLDHEEDILRESTGATLLLRKPVRLVSLSRSIQKVLQS